MYLHKLFELLGGEVNHNRKNYFEIACIKWGTYDDVCYAISNNVINN